MRLRTDGWHTAGWKRAAAVGGRTDVAPSILEDPTPAAELGDVWVIRFVPEDEREEEWAGAGIVTTYAESKGPIVGYALTCPNEACRFGVHDWTWACNCDQKLPEGEGSRCAHMRDRTSCWTWTGSVEAGDLTGNPSLLSPAPSGGCGWHGYLRSGQLVAV